jgi:putative nucleotidyltransferase-like protein
MSDLAAERELARLSTGTRARREANAERLARLAAKVDWSALTQLLLAGRVLTMLGPRILAIAGERASERFQEKLAAALERGRHQEVLLQLAAGLAMDALGATGIRSAALKGPLLGEAIYGEPGRRPSSDVDLLVAAEDLHRAVEVARSLGYEGPIDRPMADGLPLLHFSLTHGNGELPPLELHWRIHWYERRFAHERLLPPSPESPNDWRPPPEDELAALLLYYARDGFTGLRQASDLGAWWDRFGPEVRNGAVDKTSAAYPELGPALATALARAQSAVGLPPSLNRQELRPRQRLAVQLAVREPVFHSTKQLFAEIGLIDGLLTPSGGTGAFIRRQVFPPREVIRERAEKDGDAPIASPLAYGLSALARFGLALGRLLLRRPRRPPC